MRFRVFLLLFGLLSLAARPAAAQGFDVRSAVPPDSVHSDADERVGQPDSLRRRFDEQRTLARLQAYTRRKTIAGRLASGLFNFTQRQQEQAGLDAVLLDRQFDRHNFKVVRRISIRTLDAFGFSLTDTLRQPRTFWEKSGNVLHLKTSRSRIRQVLLFRAGRALEPQALAESERLLRQTPEILDARVLVNERTTTRDSVDIEVLTTDVFSISAGIEVGSATAGVVTFGDDNFLGQGHQVANEYRYGRVFDQPGAQTWAYEGAYTAPFRHFFYGQARYRDEYNFRSGGAALRRDFYSPSTRYAGALGIDYFAPEVWVAPAAPGEAPTFRPLRYAVGDAWLGRALRLRSYDMGFENPGRVVVSARLTQTRFQQRPLPDVYNNSTLVLGTVGYSVRRYYKDRYLFGFGRTEDVPAGTLLSLTAGYDDNAAGPRRYLGLRLAGAGFSLRHGYLYLGGEFGSFQRLGGNRRWEQGALGTQATYFTRLYHAGNWQYRHFLNSRAVLGFNRLPGERLQGISNERGLRGFSPATDIVPTSRFVLNYETTLFTPVSLLGFRLAGVAFADAAWITTRPSGGLPFGETPYTAFGLGLRFRNEYTALRTFQLLLGYYPRGLATPNGIKLFESARETVQFTDFGLGAPGTNGYQ